MPQVHSKSPIRVTHDFGNLCIFDGMEKPQDAENAFVAAAIEHQLMLWQTTRSLLEIDERLNDALTSGRQSYHPPQKGLIEQVKNLFTNFGSS